MGWVSLSLRKQSLKAAIADDQLRLLQISRSIRSVARHLSYEQSVFDAEKTKELNDAKEKFDAVRNDRPNVNSDNYRQWQDDYEDAKVEYEAEKTDINDYYDYLLSDIEQDSKDQQTTLEDEQGTVEAELESLQTELSNIQESISNEIKNSAVKFS